MVISFLTALFFGSLFFVFELFHHGEQFISLACRMENKWLKKGDYHAKEKTENNVNDYCWRFSHRRRSIDLSGSP
jgi:hypothetical protein